MRISYDNIVKGRSKLYDELLLFIYLRDPDEGLVNKSWEEFEKIIQSNTDALGGVIQYSGSNIDYLNDVLIRCSINFCPVILDYRQEICPKDLDITNLHMLRIGTDEEISEKSRSRIYEVQLSREIDERGDPIYGLVDITEKFWNKLN